MAIKTLLLCFIHGFKGDEETFYQFPEDLKTAISTSNPNLTIETRVYPKYETRGDLALSVTTFKEWLQSQTTALETASSNPAAITDPSVSVILVAHSMGGFVAADTLFSVLDNRPISSDPNTKLMFPLIQGVLAFDTPYNGLSRSMFAYGAFSQYQNISSAWNLLSTGTAFLSTAGARTAATSQAKNQLATRGANSNNSWVRWSALAARTGTYGAIMAGGVAAYIHRDTIIQSLKGINRENLSKISYANTRDAVTSINYTDSISQGLTYVSRESIGEGFAWMAGHLKFVGALMKTTQLTTRLERLSEIEGVGVKCLYTSLGENGIWNGGYFVPKRTFCAIAEKGEKMQGLFIECPDTKAGNEIVAHCGMFRKDKNENYPKMLQISANLVKEWVGSDPRKVRDEWKPSEEQLKRSRSESKVWDDDGKVLKPPGGEGEEEQLQAILKSDEMPHGEDGGVDEKELMERAAGVPLPVEEDVIGEGMLGDSIQEAEAAVRSAEAEKPVEETAAEGKALRETPTGISTEKQASESETKLSEAQGDDKSSEEALPPMTEHNKPLKMEDNQLAEEMGNTSLNDKLQATETKESGKETPTEEPKQEQTEAAPKKTWIGMIPSVPSFSSSKSKEAGSESKTEGQDELSAEKDAPTQKTWASMIPSVPSFSAKQPETTQKKLDGKPEGKEDGTEQPETESKKKWFGVV